MYKSARNIAECQRCAGRGVERLAGAAADAVAGDAVGARQDQGSKRKREREARTGDGGRVTKPHAGLKSEIDDMTHPLTPEMHETAAEGKLHLVPHQIILRPLVTEKGVHRSTRHNAYAFEVNKLANKRDVHRAVEELFNVKVIRVQHPKSPRQAAPQPLPLPAAPTIGKKRSSRSTRNQDQLLLKRRPQTTGCSVSEGGIRENAAGYSTPILTNGYEQLSPVGFSLNNMGIRRYNPTTPGRRGASVSDFAELTPGAKPVKGADDAQEDDRRAEQPGRDHRPASRRRAQAALPA